MTILPNQKQPFENTLEELKLGSNDYYVEDENGYSHISNRPNTEWAFGSAAEEAVEKFESQACEYPDEWEVDVWNNKGEHKAFVVCMEPSRTYRAVEKK